MHTKAGDYSDSGEVVVRFAIDQRLPCEPFLFKGPFADHVPYPNGSKRKARGNAVLVGVTALQQAFWHCRLNCPKATLLRPISLQHTYFAANLQLSGHLKHSSSNKIISTQTVGSQLALNGKNHCKMRMEPFMQAFGRR